MEKQINAEIPDNIKIEEERDQSSSIIREFTLQFYRKKKLRDFLAKAKDYNRDQIDVNQLNKKKKVSDGVRVFITDVIKKSIFQYKEYYLNMLRSFLKKYSNKLTRKILSDHKIISKKISQRAAGSEIIRNFVKNKIKKKPKTPPVKKVQPKKPAKKEYKFDPNARQSGHCRETCPLCNPALLDQFYKQQTLDQYKKEKKENHNKVLTTIENTSINKVNKVNKNMNGTISNKKASVIKTEKSKETKEVKKEVKEVKEVKANNDNKSIKSNIKSKPKTSTVVGMNYKKLDPPVLTNKRASARIMESKETKKIKAEKAEKVNIRGSAKEKELNSNNKNILQESKKLNKTFNTQRN